MNTNVDIDKLLVSLFNMTPISKENKYLLQEALKKQGLVFNGTEITSIKESKEPLFNAGDWVVYDGWVTQIVRVDVDGYVNSEQGFIPKDREDCFRLWTIQDAKDGDVLVFKNNIGGIIICKSPTDYETRSYCRLIDDSLINKEESGWDSTLLVPAIKKQSDLLFQKIKEAGYEWDAEKKELKKIEQKPIDKPKFKVKYAGSEYNVFKTKDIAGVTFYGIEDEPNHIDYVKADNCEIISGYGIKESGLSIPTKPVMFSEQKTAWSEEDENAIQVLKDIVKHSNEINENIYTMPLKEKLYDWLKSIKDRVQPKQECSEEDEERIKSIISVLDVQVCWDGATGKKGNPYQKEIDWLKSLRPQNRWKPSEEQIKALETTLYTNMSRNDERYSVLSEFVSELKKLKGE